MSRVRPESNPYTTKTLIHECQPPRIVSTPAVAIPSDARLHTPHKLSPNLQKALLFREYHSIDWCERIGWESRFRQMDRNHSSISCPAPNRSLPDIQLPFPTPVPSLLLFPSSSLFPLPLSHSLLSPEPLSLRHKTSNPSNHHEL